MRHSHFRQRSLAALGLALLWRYSLASRPVVIPVRSHANAGASCFVAKAIFHSRQSGFCRSERWRHRTRYRSHSRRDGSHDHGVHAAESFGCVGLHPGDKLTAQLQLEAQGAVLSSIVILQQANLNVLPPIQYHVPQIGDTVPDFRFLNQSNREISLKQFRGKVLVLTFIYTRCASSQFCPLMSRNFAHLDQLLAADPALYAQNPPAQHQFRPQHTTRPRYCAAMAARTRADTPKKPSSIGILLHLLPPSLHLYCSGLMWP